MILTIFLWTFLGSIVSLIGGIILAIRKKPFTHVQSMLVVSFAAGVLLATAIFDLLPEAAELFEQGAGLDHMWKWVLVGILFLFFSEKLFVWYHHHHEEHAHAKAVPIMITVGDTIHNMIDGIVIAATFMTDYRVGIITALAVAAHEIPHEMGDFGILLAKGWSRWKTIGMNLLSACSSFVGALLMIAVGQFATQLLPILLAFSAGSFIYLACSDLIPELHHDTHKHQRSENLVQIGVFVVGIGLIWWLVRLLEG